MLINGHFSPNGTGAVTAPIGLGWTVARTGVGVFTITLEDAYKEFESGQAQVQLDPAADTFAQLGAYDATARTLVLRTLTGGAAADIASGANNTVQFQLVMKNTA